ncbi:NAD(P)-dependent oxidoreductase [Acidianus sp. RZ1]|uniref:SDR family oxidoreductase n=1 Tax=Acidianus sp. RZ1 TaxID=1540082 RepID=UPI0014920510|nr:NAD(P)-dependent oxidoreductase [Acidianus sp. RZ1]
MSKVLIIGCSSQLGKGLIKAYSNDQIFCTYFSNKVDEGIKLDLQNFVHLEDLILKLRPEVIINASAYTDVDGCEVNKERAYIINAEVVKHMVRTSRVIGAYFVHVSTDYVFDGEKGMYREADLPSPINYYGLTKLIGETYALSYDDSLVVRTSGVFGYKNNFPTFAMKSLHDGKEISAWDSYYSPIHADLLGKAIHNLEKMKKTGVIHIAGERVSRYELAIKIAEKINARNSLVKLVPPQNTLAKRPKDSSLDIAKAKDLLDFDFYSLDVNLDILIKGGNL